MVGPFIVEIEKKASGSGLYIPWRGTYWAALIFLFEKVYYMIEYVIEYWKGPKGPEEAQRAQKRLEVPK